LKAEIKPGYEQNRVRLAEKIPLDTPFTILITPSQLCNFKCNYCTQSWDHAAKEGIGFKAQLLDYDVFLKLANQMSQFEKPFKQVSFTGLGEPLLNPKLPDMIRHLKELKVGEKIEVYTNASFLTREMTHKLVDAGLTRLRISIQGLSSEKYKQICGVDMNFNELVSNIKYFYDNRKNCKLYIKIIDSCLDNDSDRERFYSLFGDICDEIYIEHLVIAQHSMGDYSNKVDSSLTLYGEEAVEKEVCPQIFYVLQTDALGNVFPCTPLGLPESFSLGNINKTSLIDIWNGNRLNSLRITHLEKKRYLFQTCDKCPCVFGVTHKSDILDNDCENILKKIR